MIGRSLTIGDARAALQDSGARYAQQVEQLATENDSRIVSLITDVVRVPLALLLLAWGPRSLGCGVADASRKLARGTTGSIRLVCKASSFALKFRHHALFVGPLQRSRERYR
jgi:hypothetical protein